VLSFNYVKAFGRANVAYRAEAFKDDVQGGKLTCVIVGLAYTFRRQVQTFDNKKAKGI
jgi:hypothetical protein